MDKAKKDLVIPKSLGNFVTEGGSGGGVSPEEAAEIASAVTEAAIDEYNIELEVELEEIREAISGNTDTLLDLATIAAMSVADRVALFDEIFEKVSNGEKIYIKGLVQEETIRTAILPLVSYRPETNPVLHQGGNLYFAAKGDTDNVYFHIGLTSEGSIDPTSGNIIKRNVYNLPTASAEVKGGVRIGSGLTMTQDTLSVDTTGLVTDGDLAPFIVQQSANTENIATLSAATGSISESLGNYATTAVTNELATAISGVSDSLANYATTATTDALSAVTSALTESVAGKQDTLSAGNGIDLSGNTISVKIGEGLAFSGNTLVVSGGSDEQNYVIVDQLSDITNPVEGMLAYAKFKRLNGWIFDATSVVEDFALRVYYDGVNSTAVYRSTDGTFHWGWNNSATDWVFENNIWYKIDTENGLFYAACENPNAYAEPLNGATTASTTAELVVDKLYLYNGTAWEEKNFPAKEYYLNNMADAERMALYDEITDLLGGDSNSPNLPKLYSNYKFFIKYETDGQRWCEAFFTNFENNDIWFAGLKPDKMSYNMNIHRTCASLHSDGTIDYTDTTFPNFNSLANDIYLTLDSNGRLKSDNLGDFSELDKFNRMVLVYQDENINNNFCSAPLKYFYRKNETIDGQDKLVEYIGGEININGTWYKGAWHFVEWEWSEWTTPDTWTTI